MEKAAKGENVVGEGEGEGEGSDQQIQQNFVKFLDKIIHSFSATST